MYKVDHMYHYLTNTHDDDGHVLIEQHHTSAVVSQADAQAALAGEEPLTEMNPSAVKSGIDPVMPLLDDVMVELDEDQAVSDEDLAASRVAELALAEENPQEYDAEGHEHKEQEEQQEKEVTEDQRQELKRIEAGEMKAERETALRRDMVALIEMGAQELIAPMAR